MNHTTTNHPRMAAVYTPGTVRARRWHGEDDVRGYRSPSGWSARATSPTFIPSQAAPCRVPCGGLSRRRNNRDRHRAQAVPPWARWTRNPGAAVAAPGVEGIAVLSDAFRHRPYGPVPEMCELHSTRPPFPSKAVISLE